MNSTPRLCDSAGHGLNSRTKGQVDPGAEVVGEGTEASKTLDFATKMHANHKVLLAGHPGALAMFVNASRFDLVDDKAAAAGCEWMLEYHFNATTVRRNVDGKEVGVEVLYGRKGDAAYAAKLSAHISAALGLPDRGAKYEPGMAVLHEHKGMRSVIVELCFGTDADDMRAFRRYSERAELAIVNVNLDQWGWRNVKHLPRKWGPIRKAYYRRAWKRR